jgi:hypothetical protein
VDVEKIMIINRQFFGDLVLAVALVMPTATLAKAQAANHEAAAKSPVMAKAAVADRAINRRGVGLLG